MTEVKCCVCFELDNHYATITCDRCLDGIVCLDCITEMDDLLPIDEPNKCPCCRSILISYYIKNIMFNAMLYKTEGSSNNLYSRWYDNINLGDSDLARF